MSYNLIGHTFKSEHYLLYYTYYIKYAIHISILHINILISTVKNHTMRAFKSIILQHSAIDGYVINFTVV